MITARTAAALAAIAVTGTTLAACGTTQASAPASKAPAAATSAPAAAPAAATVPAGDATQVLTADGYTPVLTEDQATINSTFGDAAPYITSAAGGTGDSNSKMEISIVISQQGVAATGGPGSLLAALQSKMPGVTVTVVQRSSDDLIRADGPLSAFSMAG